MSKYFVEEAGKKCEKKTNLEGQLGRIKMKYLLSNCRKYFKLVLADASNITQSRQMEDMCMCVCGEDPNP